jgi:cell wall-associated NlpC family hydrolase
LQLKSGDLLFTGVKKDKTASDFSDAINRVTQTSRQTNYTHVGIVEKNGDEIWVIHAAPEKGVCRESLHDFFRTDNRDVITVYRLKAKYRDLIPDALKRAAQYIGQPYDFGYVLNDTSQYCSGLIFRIFNDAELFTLNPMTFKNPETGDFLPFWIEHYKQLNRDIPENIPGCNPNGMAINEALEYLGELRKLINNANQ